MNSLTLNDAANILSSKDDICILCHDFPDGDTLGSGFALFYALKQKKKRVKLLCSSNIPKKFGYLCNIAYNDDFKEKFIVAVDVADTQLLGERIETFKNRVDLCIDHHVSNTFYAKNTLLDSDASSAAEVMTELLCEMNANIDKNIANCLYTGVCTDTGCFKFSNVSPKTFKIAAFLMEMGAETHKINKIMFDTKSRARLKIERFILDNIKMYFNDRCAVSYVTDKAIAESNATEGDIDGVSALTRQIEGVILGVFLREKKGGTYKVSFRGDGLIDCSKLGSYFGGGGHKNAAGCEIYENTPNDAIRKILSVIKQEFN